MPIACANKVINGEMAVLNDVGTYFCSEANDKQTVIFKLQLVFGCEITGWQMCVDHILFSLHRLSRLQYTYLIC